MKTLTPSEVGPFVESVIENTPSETEILIVQDGKPIAKLECPLPGNHDMQKWVEEVRELRKGNRLDGLTIREMINEGRR
jgi:hypothetical protein